jgi:hypothetical protein
MILNGNSKRAFAYPFRISTSSSQQSWLRCFFPPDVTSGAGAHETSMMSNCQASATEDWWISSPISSVLRLSRLLILLFGSCGRVYGHV